MWLNPNTRLFSTDDSSGHLVQVVMCFPPQNQLKVHVLNTFGSANTANGRRTGWELLWGDNGDFENAERRTPVSHKYKPTFAPWIEDVHFEDLIPMAISVTGGTTSPTSKKGKGKAKPKAFTIPLSFWEQHVVQATPPTWDEHATHLRDRQHDPPPRKGVAARRRTTRASPTAQGSASRDAPRPSNGTRDRPSRQAAQRSGFASHIHGTGFTGKEWKLVASIRELHREAASHGYPKTNCFIRPLSSTTSPTAGMCRTQASDH